MRFHKKLDKTTIFVIIFDINIPMRSVIMYKMCKTEQSAARQRQLEQGLLSAMLTMRYEDINLSDMCQQLEIPRKSFYRYFSGKDGALQALIDHTLMEYGTYSAGLRTERRTLELDLEQFFQFWQTQKDLLDALQRSDLSGILVERSIRHAVTESFFPGRFLQHETKLMKQHVVSFAMCGLMTLMVQWHHNGYQETPAELAQVSSRLLTKPLFPTSRQLF